MNLRQQLIQDRVDTVAKALTVPIDKAFVRLTHSIITGVSLHAFDQADLVDGGQDKQIDTISIIQDEEEATVHIISAKNVDTFSSNAIIQMRNGLDWIFNKQKADVQGLSNTRFKDRINDLRSALSGLGYSNVSIEVVFVTMDSHPTYPRNLTKNENIFLINMIMELLLDFHLNLGAQTS